MKYGRVLWNDQGVYARLDEEYAYLLQENPIVGETEETGEILPLSNAKLLAPCQPSKVVAVGINYLSHAGEMGDEIPEDPVIFIKPSTAVIGPEEMINRPAQSQRVDYESELALVIRKTCSNVREEDWRDYVFGYTCLNDVTARDLQKKDGQWTRGKGFDTFCPMGPWIKTDFDPSSAEIIGRLNGKEVQHSNTSLLINHIPKLIAYISAVMTLLPGDVITTGTPSGIGPMAPGDTMEVEVKGIGVLRNHMK